MGRPAVMGRSIIRGMNGVICGVALGYGGFSEHNFYSLEDGVALVKRFNQMPRRVVDVCFISGYSSDVATKLLKENKADLKLIKKKIRQYSGSEYPRFANFVLRPHLLYEKRKIIIDNSKFEGNPALEDGNYSYISFNGVFTYEISARLFTQKFQRRRKFCESELFYSPDYANDIFHQRDKFFASYSTTNCSLVVAFKSPEYDDIVEKIENCLKEGMLALIPNINVSGKYYQGLNIVFLNRFLEGRRIV